MASGVPHTFASLVSSPMRPFTKHPGYPAPGENNVGGNNTRENNISGKNSIRENTDKE